MKQKGNKNGWDVEADMEQERTRLNKRSILLVLWRLMSWVTTSVSQRHGEVAAKRLELLRWYTKLLTQGGSNSIIVGSSYDHQRI